MKPFVRGNRENDSDTVQRRVLSTFLNEMDGIDTLTKDQVIVIESYLSLITNQVFQYYKSKVGQETETRATKVKITGTELMRYLQRVFDQKSK